jgi:phosphotransferase system enzyme I (PtsI)
VETTLNTPILPKSEKRERIFQGTPVSGGVAHGFVRHVGGSFEPPAMRRISMEKVEEELARFHQAVASTRGELEKLMEGLDEDLDRHTHEILGMHIMVLEDSFVREQVENFVREGLECAESAYYRVVKNCMDSFNRMPDVYLRERALDIKDVALRVLKHLRGDDGLFDDGGASAICIAHDLTPSETVQLDRNRVLGFAVELGSRTSHTAIVARALGLPAVVRLHGIVEALEHGDEVLLDGNEGILVLNPTAETLERYKALAAAVEAKEAQLLAGGTGPAQTTDGNRVLVGANVEFVEELPLIAECGAEGVGLFRTEFLYLEDPNASEEKLTAVYSEVAAKVAPQQVIFRTLDVGGDKLLEYDREPEQNPFLGWRGIRVSLALPEAFKKQLRAILRASAHGNVGIMYPMISGVAEVIEANRLLAECREELVQQGVNVGSKVQIGAMIEVPGAAVIADLLTPHVDFFSIGTNDLVQYTLAVDRVNERVSELYQQTHPGVLRLIKTVVDAAHRAKIWVGICGEMAGDVSLTPLLVGLGLDELSASSPQVAAVKHAIRKLSTKDCRELVDEVLKEGDAVAIHKLAHAMALEKYPELFPATMVEAGETGKV